MHLIKVQHCHTRCMVLLNTAPHTHLVRHCWQQHTIRGVQVCHNLRVASLQGQALQQQAAAQGRQVEKPCKQQPLIPGLFVHLAMPMQISNAVPSLALSMISVFSMKELHFSTSCMILP